MSKYKAGDKVVVEIEKAALTDNGGGFYIVLDYMQSAISVDEKSEPLTAYTEPLEAKIRRQATEITRLLAENKELKEDFEKSKRVNLNMGRRAGQNEAWELARKIVLKNGYSAYDLHEIFNCCGSHQALEDYTYPEAAAKVAEWEKAKEEIKVGDVVRGKSDIPSEFCVTEISSHGRLYGIGRNGGTYSGRDPKDWHKTGRHIDIDGFLKQIRGEEK